MRVNKSMPVSDRHQHRDGSNVASCDDEYLKGSLAGGMQMDRRTFTAWLLAAPFVMKAGLGSRTRRPALLYVGRRAQGHVPGW